MAIQIKQAFCNGCGSCIEICSVGAIRITNNKANIDSTRCIKCKMCLTVCTQNAIVFR